jgi:hypothetical protein
VSGQGVRFFCGKSNLRPCFTHEIFYKKALDGVINLVEMKFSVDPFTLSKAHRDAIQRQQAVFQHVTKTRKRLSPALIAASGIDGGARWQAVFDAVFDAGILFEE